MTEPSLGRRIRRARGAAGARMGRRISQAELGAWIGRSRSAVNSWETGRTIPADDDVAAIEEVLDVNLRDPGPPPVSDRVSRMIGELTPEERDSVVEYLTGRPAQLPHRGQGADAGRHRRAS